MNTASVRLNVTLPKDLVHDLDRHVGSRKKSQYIAMALRNQMARDRRAALEKDMEEGYRRNKHESLAIAGTFEDADLEGWDDY